MNIKYWRGTCKTPLKGADHVAYGLKIHLYPTIRHYTILYYIGCVILNIAIVLHKHSIKHELLKTLGFDFCLHIKFPGGQKNILLHSWPQQTHIDITFTHTHTRTHTQAGVHMPLK